MCGRRRYAKQRDYDRLPYYWVRRALLFNKLWPLDKNVRAGNEDGGVINWMRATKSKASAPPPCPPPPENAFAVLETSHMERWKTSGLCASDPPVFETEGVRVEKSSTQECVIKIAIR